MANIPLHSSGGEKVGEVQLKDEVFSVPVREDLIHNAVVILLSNRRRGQARTKSRAEVRGGGIKPWRQKGTGRARAGSNRSPVWRTGGVAHGPDGRNYSLKLPKKAKRKALCSALSGRVLEGKITVVDNFQFDSPKTKEAAKTLKNLELTGKVLVVDSNPGENLRKSFRNIEGVQLQDPLSLNTYDVMSCDHLLISKESIEILERRIVQDKVVK